MTLLDLPTCLYRLFDREGRLLYVGISVSPGYRFYQHKATKAWWPDVDSARTTLALYDTRPEAATAEVAAIRAEKPVHNIVAAEGRTWGRPKTVLNPVQEQALAEVELSAREAEEAKKELWGAVRAAHKLDVPPAHLAESAKRARSTVYRHLPDQVEESR